MKLVIQRVTEASVTVNGVETARIGEGLLVLLGVAKGDDESSVARAAAKLVRLRIFNDADGKMNRSVADVNGSVLVVSQFTLMADCRRGNRPSFERAALPESAEQLYLSFVAGLRNEGIRVQTGVFRADMKVSLVNDGPVTIILDLDLYNSG